MEQKNQNLKTTTSRCSVQTLIMKHEQELERISGLTQEEAVKELQRVEEELSQDIAILVKEKEKKRKKS